MNVGDIRHIYAKARKDKLPMPRLACESDGRIFESVQAFRDSYGNGYAVLSEFKDDDMPVVANPQSSIVGAKIEDARPYDWKNPLSSLDDDAPIYVQENGGTRLLGTCLPDDDDIMCITKPGKTGNCDVELPDTVFFSTYVPSSDVLPKAENRVLVILNVVQNVLFALFGFLLVLLTGTSQPIRDVISSMEISLPFIPHAVESILFALCAASILVGLAVLQGAIGNKDKRDINDRQQRQGIIGEIFQLGAPTQALYFALTGIGEEMLFRYGICGTMMGVSCSVFGLDVFSSFAIACVASSAIFTVAHSNTYDFPILLVVFVYAVVLACSWVLSGSIITAIVAHGLYDFVAAMMARYRMKKDPRKFFFGKRPNAMVSSKLGIKGSQNAYEILF